MLMNFMWKIHFQKQDAKFLPNKIFTLTDKFSLCYTTCSAWIAQPASHHAHGSYITVHTCNSCSQSVFDVCCERASFSSSQRVLLSTTYVCYVFLPPLHECANQLSYNDNHLSIHTHSHMHTPKHCLLRLLTISKAAYKVSRKINGVLTETKGLGGGAAELFSVCFHTFLSGRCHSKSWWASRLSRWDSWSAGWG